MIHAILSIVGVTEDQGWKFVQENVTVPEAVKRILDAERAQAKRWLKPSITLLINGEHVDCEIVDTGHSECAFTVECKQASEQLSYLRQLSADFDVLMGAEWQQSVKAVNGDPEAARQHRIGALLAQLEDERVARQAAETTSLSIRNRIGKILEDAGCTSGREFSCCSEDSEILDFEEWCDNCKISAILQEVPNEVSALRKALSSLQKELLTRHADTERMNKLEELGDVSILRDWDEDGGITLNQWTGPRSDRECHEVSRGGSLRAALDNMTNNQSKEDQCSQ
jgi:hypothetical protein